MKGRNRPKSWQRFSTFPLSARAGDQLHTPAIHQRRENHRRCTGQHPGHSAPEERIPKRHHSLRHPTGSETYC
jgi:hypothetical protein